MADAAIAARQAELLYRNIPAGQLVSLANATLLGKLEGARQATERANRAKTEFLANVSHKLRTPMNGIVGMAELLALDELTPGQGEYLAILRRSADDLPPAGRRTERGKPPRLRQRLPPPPALRAFRRTGGQSSLPGFISPRGSIACLTARIRDISSGLL